MRATIRIRFADVFVNDAEEDVFVFILSGFLMVFDMTMVKLCLYS